jgi:acyl-phosphate glycerol 3-phosphate acyltransferase
MTRRWLGHAGRYSAVVIGSYLAGSLPVVYLLGRFAGVDLRRYGSGNVGSSNLTAAAGLGAGLAGGISDAARGALAVLVTRRLARDEALAGWALLAALAGQCWPPLLGWRGGRGVATLVGGMLALTPWAAPWLLGTIAAIACLRPLARGQGAISKTLRRGVVPVGVLAGAIVWPFACACQTRSRRSTPTALAAALLLCARRFTANDWPTAGTVRSVLPTRLLLDRDRW